MSLALTSPTHPKCFAEQLFNQGLTPGSLIEIHTLVEYTGLKADSKQLSFWVSHLRQILASHGLYLSGEGHNGQAWEIFHQRDNQWVAKVRTERHTSDRKFLVTLLTATDETQLTPLELKRHQETLRRIRIQQQMIDHAKKKNLIIREIEE